MVVFRSASLSLLACDSEVISFLCKTAFLVSQLVQMTCLICIKAKYPLNHTLVANGIVSVIFVILCRMCDFNHNHS